MIVAAEQEAWSVPPILTSVCVLSLVVYGRGFFLLRRTRSSFSPWRFGMFASGIGILWGALGSPLEELADSVFTAHMVEHLLLMAAVPPLLLLGWPTVPMLRGLPGWLRRVTVNPLLRSRLLRGGLHWLESPVVAWILMNVSLLLWHLPSAYDYALEHERWHVFEHVCFLSTSLLFWWVLLRPWPSQAKDLGWWAPVYLVTADIVNTALSATLAFVGHPVYPYYVEHANEMQLSPMTDQSIGASLMWVFGSVAFLIPALALTARNLQEPTR